MKKILLLLVLFFTSCSAYAGIDINYDDGIYHIALTGEKIKKRISFISSEGLITNKEAHQRTNILHRDRQKYGRGSVIKSKFV